MQDNVTGLIWEAKTNDNGLHDEDDKYTLRIGSVGDEDYRGDICYAYDASDPSGYCNTEVFAERVNAVSLCGANDWRRPNRDELPSIVYYGQGIARDIGINPLSNPHSAAYHPAEQAHRSQPRAPQQHKPQPLLLLKTQALEQIIHPKHRRQTHPACPRKSIQTLGATLATKNVVAISGVRQYYRQQ